MGRVKKSAFYLIYGLFLVFLLEGAALLFYYALHGEYRPPSEFYRNPNLILQASDETECSWAETLVPHPYLSYVHVPSGQCDESKWAFNRLGFFGPEIPLERDERTFDILLTGGSVAAYLGQMSRRGPKFLEVALNAKYESPTGRPFRVLNGAIGGWQQPHQLVMTALYGQSVSAIVTLEGYNELQRFYDAVPFRMSRSSWPVHDELVAASFGREAALTNAETTFLMRRAISGTPILRNSKFVYALYDLTRALLAKLGDKSLPETVEDASERHLRYEASYAFPAALTAEARLEWNLRQYRHYMSMADAMAKRIGVRSAFFLQPAPHVDKPLTEDERKRLTHRDYSALYRRLVEDLLSLREEGVEVVSLLDVFSTVTETIYGDSIHPEFDWETGESAGLRIIAERMAEELARAWQLAPKQV